MLCYPSGFRDHMLCDRFGHRGQLHQASCRRRRLSRCPHHLHLDTCLRQHPVRHMLCLAVPLQFPGFRGRLHPLRHVDSCLQPPSLGEPAPQPPFQTSQAYEAQRVATNTCNALWYRNYWGFYWGDPWTPGAWDTPVAYRGCSQWRAILAFSFIVSMIYLLSSILVSPQYRGLGIGHRS